MVPFVAKDMIKLRILRGKAYHGLSKWAQYNHRGLKKGKAEGEIWRSHKEEEMCRRRQRLEQCDHCTINADSYQKLEDQEIDTFTAFAGSTALLTP